MKRKIVLLAVAVILCIGSVAAQTGDTQFALFKRTIAPVMRWGENGILTVPKATTLGRANFFIGAMGQKAGTLQGLDLYLTSASVMAGTSDDVELGYTRRQLIWEDLYFKQPVDGHLPYEGAISQHRRLLDSPGGIRHQRGLS